MTRREGRPRRRGPSAAPVLLALGLTAAPLLAQRLPLVEVPAASDSTRVPDRPLCFLFSGDGNWSGADKAVAEAFARAGIPVVGLKARAYLRGGRRTPEGTTKDVSRVLREYLARWGRRTLILVGYSRGADLMPFIVDRLDADLRSRIRMVALLDPQPNANFTFHWSDLVRDQRRPSDLPVLPEVERMAGLHMVCVYGSEESDSLCPKVPKGLMDVVVRPGKHDMGGEGAMVGRLLLDHLEPPS